MLVFSNPRVTDHTDFSFSRVERNEVTDYASVHPPYRPKISSSTQKDAKSLSFLLIHSNKLSDMLEVESLCVQPYNALYSL